MKVEDAAITTLVDLAFNDVDFATGNDCATPSSGYRSMIRRGDRLVRFIEELSGSTPAF